jgi:hypothetical protein
LDSAYPELRLDPSFPLLRRNTALISNESGQNIYAVTVKWTLQTETGTSVVTYDHYVESHVIADLITKSVVLAPHEVRLVSPSIALRKGQSRNGIIAQLRANSAALKGQTILNSSLDGVILGDGTFVGADEARLLDRFECDRNGQHDEGYSMKLALNPNFLTMTLPRS